MPLADAHMWLQNQTKGESHRSSPRRICFGYAHASRSTTAGGDSHCISPRRIADPRLNRPEVAQRRNALRLSQRPAITVARHWREAPILAPRGSSHGWSTSDVHQGELSEPADRPVPVKDSLDLQCHGHFVACAVDSARDPPPSAASALPAGADPDVEQALSIRVAVAVAAARKRRALEQASESSAERSRTDESQGDGQLDDGARRLASHLTEEPCRQSELQNAPGMQHAGKSGRFNLCRHGDGRMHVAALEDEVNVLLWSRPGQHEAVKSAASSFDMRQRSYRHAAIRAAREATVAPASATARTAFNARCRELFRNRVVLAGPRPPRSESTRPSGNRRRYTGRRMPSHRPAPEAPMQELHSELKWIMADSIWQGRQFRGGENRGFYDDDSVIRRAVECDFGKALVVPSLVDFMLTNDSKGVTTSPSHAVAPSCLT